MRPELFSIAGAPVHAYPALLAVSFMVCTLLAVRESRKRPGGIELTPEIGIWAMVGALLGARIFFVVQYESPSDWWRALRIWEGGLVFYGGLIGGVAASAVHLRLRRTPFLNAADSAAPYLALGEGITRIGCFLNGCCWGAVCDLPWAVRFPAGSPAHIRQVEQGLIGADALHALAVHPTQLYMTAGLVLVCVVLKVMLVRPRAAGVVFFCYLLIYGLLRFSVELVRGDSARSVGGITVSGAISLALVLAGAMACGIVWRRAGRQSQ